MGDAAAMAAKKKKMLEARGQTEAAEAVSGDAPETAGKSKPAPKKK